MRGENRKAVEVRRSRRSREGEAERESRDEGIWMI